MIKQLLLLIKYTIDFIIRLPYRGYWGTNCSLAVYGNTPWPIRDKLTGVEFDSTAGNTKLVSFVSVVFCSYNGLVAGMLFHDIFYIVMVFILPSLLNFIL